MDIALLSILWGSMFGAGQPASTPFFHEELIIIAEPQKSRHEVIKTYAAEVTAYTSRIEETDSTPFTTASGTTVRWGTVATNSLPIGTKLRFPELYGEKIFVVEDRMHSRFQKRLDIWFSELGHAKRFGLRTLKVEIIQENVRTDIARL